ncbi:hypothetical protein [Salinimicrobium sp. HB62]|uniref:hypothetical protein n=1 Tax=Salinimicrobium sp. HB62 TaxID=3077781 RepID=UPI002D7A3BF8|nr:hypothetical protein [Salinimicrobium sp. HB62]
MSIPTSYTYSPYGTDLQGFSNLVGLITFIKTYKVLKKDLAGLSSNFSGWKALREGIYSCIRGYLKLAECLNNEHPNLIHICGYKFFVLRNSDLVILTSYF